MELQSISDKYVLEKQKRLFNIYLLLPLIIMLLIFLGSFVWGIVDATVFKVEMRVNTSSNKEIFYGVLGLHSGFGCWIVWNLIGVVSGIAAYYVSRFILSYKVLHICYLESIYELYKANTTLKDVGINK